MGLLFGVFLGGGAGALTRSALNAAVMRRWSGKFPMGTLVLNVSGSFFLGLVVGYAAANTSPEVQDFAAIVGTGFIGAYTTFSTEEWQSLMLLKQEGPKMEALNLIVSLGLSLAVAAVGLWLGGEL